MGSNKDWLMKIGWGIAINAHKNQKSQAWAHKKSFSYP